jgi:hypothetical protein
MLPADCEMEGRAWWASPGGVDHLHPRVAKGYNITKVSSP